MISFGNKQIIDVIISGTYITKGIFIDDSLNKTLVFSKSTTFIAPTNLNVGDAGIYSIIINNVKYNDIIITSTSNDGLIIQDNIVTFTKEGNYILTLTYKTIEKTITVIVKDIIVNID